ncbi:MAG TPA: 3-phosphoshikimate 1-carboxyvinyltransferase [Actinomycetota bacterium]|nr:3-phosphoshikimate 1-carboxyvinyltransferase [Actinomycetota bacterium]
MSRVRAIVHPGAFDGGVASVPGDKSIAHRWLILAVTGVGQSELRGLPEALDVRATASCLARIVGEKARDALDGWTSGPRPQADRDRSTANDPRPRGRDIVLGGHGRASLHPSDAPLDCSNSGTTMRLLAGVLASSPFETVLQGDASLTARPMERVAEPLRAMGADVRSTDGHPPVVVRGGPLRGIDHRMPVPSAQVKSAVLLAGLAAEGPTTVREPAPTRDHTERALAALGAPIVFEPGLAAIRAFEHGGFAATVPGDVSSAAFLAAAAVLTGRAVTIERVGLNPTRTRFVRVLERMGASLGSRVEGEELGEPVGTLDVEQGARLTETTIGVEELPLVIDEVPVLAMVAAHATGETRFEGGAELRVKESDRLGGLAEAIRALGGAAELEGDDLVIGGGGLAGGEADARGDHRMAMALAVAALAARGPVAVDGIEAAEVSFPGFDRLLVALGARIEVRA